MCKSDPMPKFVTYNAYGNIYKTDHIAIDVNYQLHE